MVLVLCLLSNVGLYLYKVSSNTSKDFRAIEGLILHYICTKFHENI